jgi:ADP-ribosyl-[dinitrogen reductase] hydrolase
VIAVGLGGDTDTTAAITGALAGAHYGYEAIPNRWRDTVQHRDELKTLAGRLFEISEETSRQSQGVFENNP